MIPTYFSNYLVFFSLYFYKSRHNFSFILKLNKSFTFSLLLFTFALMRVFDFPTKLVQN